VSNVQVTLKGKKYQIDDVTTVSELQERLEEQSGIAPSKQGKILHNGKRLSSDTESLSEAGVSGGDKLNCVPSKSKSTSSKKKASSKTTTTSAAAASASSDSSASGAGAGGGLDDVISKMMSGGLGGMPGMGGAGNGEMPDLEESMKMMKELTNSPLFSQYMNDPEKLEEARQMILNNPMMKSMMTGMPGMGDLLNDKEAWAQAMQAAAGIMQNMEPEDMMKMMEAQQNAMGGGVPGMPPGMGGAGSGLFGNAEVSPSALDELSEGE